MSEHSIYELNQRQQYMMQMRPLLRKHALFADGTKDYRNPSEPKANEQVELTFRSSRNNVDAVWLCGGNRKVPMKKQESRGEFDYYRVKVQLGTEPYHYHFEVATGMLYCCYDRMGVSSQVRPEYDFVIVPGFSTPDWAKGAVMYQILVDRFCMGDPTNNVETNEYYYIKVYSQHVDDWNKCPADFGVGEFYGGDLTGVLQKLDYLKDLGVEVLYFNPLFVSPSNHKYDIQDYDYIDPHYGRIVEDGGELLNPGDTDNTRATKYIKRVSDRRNLEASNELFATLISEAHKRGMRVILDGVFNHCGSFNKWLDRELIYEKELGYATGAYISEDSPYRNFFQFHDENHWPYNNTYDGWWGHDTLPKLNYEGSQELYDYILDIGRKWVSAPFYADGWRLDVAADLGHSVEFNHQFWRDFREAVKGANPEAIVLAEHYGDPVEWLRGDQWDTVMNYDAFMEPLTWFLTGMEKHSDGYREDMLGNFHNFEGAMNYYMTRFMTPSLLCAMNELSNHDHSRFLTRTNHKVGRVNNLGSAAAGENVNKGVLKEAVVIQMTWPGAPTIYYGDEAGVVGFTDPDNRRTYPWGREDQELLAFHRDIIRIHRENEALRTGSLKILGGEHQVMCYGRFNRQQQFIVVVNNDYVERFMEWRVWPAEMERETRLERLIMTRPETYSLDSEIYEVHDGRLKINLPPNTAVILRNIGK
ncbi:MAG: glycoside hydrolase family 13 protein [Lachnospiraceae bacterium]|jgi:alpha-glucosidase|nr:glycoside hydrolase family 13 protein [Lachnospiraceae bacterium]